MTSRSTDRTLLGITVRVRVQLYKYGAGPISMPSSYV